MKLTPRSLLPASFLLASVALAASTLAHAPFAPYDDTRFAPITRFGPAISVEVVAEGLTSPLKGVTAPGLPGFLFVIDQPGQVWAINLKSVGLDGLPQRTLFLDVSARLVTLGVLGPDTFDERGLLGIAFHPQFATNRKFYTYTSEPNNGPPTFPTTLPAMHPADHQNVVAEWKAVNAANPEAGADPGSRRELLRVDWPQFNHDGGDLAFGPDGFLYISMGDGGGADDRDGQDFIVAGSGGANAPIVGHGLTGNGQNLTNPLGKIHRIDVNGSNSANHQYGIPSNNPFVSTSGAVKEIYAFGFRNPYRFSFDSRTGDLYVGDVGQNDIEEVNIVVRGGNYGWPLKEGTLFFNHNGNLEGFARRQPNLLIPRNLKDPIAQYDTHHEGHSVIGGFVYRGSAVRDLVGRYVFGDFSLLFKFPGGPHDYGRIFHIIPGGAGLRDISQVQVLPGNALSMALLGWGQDATGELYALGNIGGVPFGTEGRVLKLVPADTHVD